MSKVFWQAKIWGLLHDPVFKALHDNSGRGKNSLWEQLAVMQEWVERGLNPETARSGVMRHIKLADFITSASDRGAIGSLSVNMDYAESGLQISHLLSGASTNFQLKPEQHQQVESSSRVDFLMGKPTFLTNSEVATAEDGAQASPETTPSKPYSDKNSQGYKDSIRLD